MRLIDADILPNDKFWEELTDIEKAKVLSWMAQSPTVDIDQPTTSQFKRMAIQLGYEPVIHGHYAHLGGDEWCCSNCGDVICTEGSWEKPTAKYCSECGAKMDEVRT